MSADPLAIAAAVLAYLLGSIPVGVLVARRRDVDVRAEGSGNIGATNVARTTGKKVGAAVLLADALKGAVAMLLALALDLEGRSGSYAVALVGVAVIAGHCFPVWLRFRGGKGVATALGVFAVAAPGALVVAASVFAAVVSLSRIVSLGSISAALVMPLFLALSGGEPALVSLGAGAAAIVIVQHRQNLRRIVRGEENRL